jgi:hypothetical protein
MSVEDLLFARSVRSGIFSILDHMLPHASYVDRLFLLARFVRAHNRWPKDPARPDATFNDLIFSRLARADWSSLERVCIDKHYVKFFIRGFCPEVRMASTVDIIKLSRATAPDIIESALLAHLGDRIVAKPTHGSGTILYLRKRPSREEIRRFAIVAAHSYYHRSRESLYAGLERKVVLEEDLSEHDNAPVDYKFFCSRGEVFFCQVDVDRFRCHKRALVTPAFEPIDVRYMHDVPTQTLDRPVNFDDMVVVAEKLSSPFSFVRVDLYCVRNAVFFGELTFAPEGGAGSLSSETFGAWVMAGVRRANDRKVPDAVAPAFLDELSRMPRKGKWDESQRQIESNPR